MLLLKALLVVMQIKKMHIELMYRKAHHFNSTNQEQLLPPNSSVVITNVDSIVKAGRERESLIGCLAGAPEKLTVEGMAVEKGPCEDREIQAEDFCQGHSQSQ